MIFKYKKTNPDAMKNSGMIKTSSNLNNSDNASNMNITQLNNGETAKVVKLYHNNKLIRKLEAMGIIPGTIITKKSSLLSNGPIIVEKGQFQFAIGYEMAQKIIVVNVD